jgi:hypothetical protein
MGKLKARTKTISLAFMGDAWKDAFVEFRALTWADAQKLQVEDMNDQAAMAALQELLQSLFVSGKSLGENDRMVELEASDLAELDIETIATITREMAGAPSPNA